MRNRKTPRSSRITVNGENWPHRVDYQGEDRRELLVDLVTNRYLATGEGDGVAPDVGTICWKLMVMASDSDSAGDRDGTSRAGGEADGQHDGSSQFPVLSEGAGAAGGDGAAGVEGVQGEAAGAPAVAVPAAAQLHAPVADTVPEPTLPTFRPSAGRPPAGREVVPQMILRTRRPARTATRPSI